MPTHCRERNVRPGGQNLAKEGTTSVIIDCVTLDDPLSHS